MTEKNSFKKPFIIFLVSVILLFVFFNCFTQMSLYENLNIVALIGTAIIIAWYTIETYHLRLIQTKQMDISILPSIIVFKAEKNDSFKIKNVGNGVAVNIKFDDTILSKELDVCLRFPQVLALLPGTTELIKIESIRNGEVVDFPFHSHFDQRYANRQWKVMVTFEDVARQKYQQILMLGMEGPYLGKIQKVTSGY
jgi:hypothetical protein